MKRSVDMNNGSLEGAGDILDDTPLNAIESGVGNVEWVAGRKLAERSVIVEQEQAPSRNAGRGWAKTLI